MTQDRELCTGTARLHLRSEGIVHIRIADGAWQGLPEAKENLAAAAQLAGGRRLPFLVDIRRAQPLPPEARHHYAGERLVEVCTALALVVEASPLGRMMGNVYFLVTRMPVPMRLFTEEQEAISWLITAGR